MSDDYDYMFKVVVVGDGSVGKTCFLLRLTDDFFREHHLQTIGIDFKVKTIEVGTHRVKAYIWDTAGQERFRSITNRYYRGAHCIIIAFDLTDRTTFKNVGRWLEEVDCHRGGSACKLLVGTKSDLVGQRSVDTREAKEYARLRGMMYAETSSKTGHCVEECFTELIAEQLERQTGGAQVPEERKDTITLVAGTDVRDGGQGWCGSCYGYTI